MPAVGQQTIGNIQRRRSLATQGLTKGQLRLWRPIAVKQLRGLRSSTFTLTQNQRQCAGRITEHPANTKQVSGPGTAAQQRLPSRYTTEYRHGEPQQATGGTAADPAPPPA